MPREGYRTYMRRMIMTVSEIEKQLETTNRIEYEGKCHDCGKGVKVCIFREKETGAITIEGGAIYNPKFGTPPAEHTFFKCDDCFKKDRVLRNWQPVETYSRVVGYLRPVSSWNKGKQEEWKMRMYYAIPKKVGK